MTRLTGLNEHTLRAWERRYGAVRPKRGENGRRVYSRLDVERLRTIARLVERGFSIGRIATLADRDLAELLAEHLSLDQPPAAPVNQSAPASFESVRIGELSRSIQGALSRYDLAAIHGDLQTARSLLGARSFALDLVAPLMTHMARLSQSGQITVGQEHGLTAIVKAHLAAITLSLAPNVAADQGGTPSFVLATMEGHFDEIGIMIAGVISATRGATIFYLGPNISAAALADAARGFKADHILLGCTQPLPGAALIDEPAYLAELDRKLHAGCSIWLNGSVSLELRSLLLSRPCKYLATLEEFDQVMSVSDRGSSR